MERTLRERQLLRRGSGRFAGSLRRQLQCVFGRGDARMREGEANVDVKLARVVADGDDGGGREGEP